MSQRILSLVIFLLPQIFSLLGLMTGIDLSRFFFAFCCCCVCGSLVCLFCFLSFYITLFQDGNGTEEKIAFEYIGKFLTIVLWWCKKQFWSSKDMIILHFGLLCRNIMSFYVFMPCMYQGIIIFPSNWNIGG